MPDLKKQRTKTRQMQLAMPGLEFVGGMASRKFLVPGLLIAVMTFSTPQAFSDNAVPDWALSAKSHREHFETDRCIWNFKWVARLAVKRRGTTGYATIKEESDNNFEFCHARSGMQGIAFADYPFPIRQVVYWFDDGTSQTIELARNPVRQIKFEDKNLIAVKASAEFVERKWEYTWSDIPDLQQVLKTGKYKSLRPRLGDASTRELHAYYESNRERLWRKMQADLPEMGPVLLALNVRQDAPKIQERVVEALNVLVAISEKDDQSGLEVALATLMEAVGIMDRLSPGNAVTQRKIAADIKLLANNSVNVAERLRTMNTVSSRQTLESISKYAKWIDFEGTPSDLKQEAAEAEQRFVENASALIDPDNAPRLAATQVAFFKDLVKWDKQSLGVMTDALSYVAQQVRLQKPIEGKALAPLLEKAREIGNGPWDRQRFRKVGKSLVPESLAVNKVLEHFFY